MPRLVIISHTYTCKVCQWRKQGDERTLSHAVKLHNRLVHKMKTGDLGLDIKPPLPKHKDPKKIYNIRVMEVEKL